MCFRKSILSGGGRLTGKGKAWRKGEAFGDENPDETQMRENCPEVSVGGGLESRSISQVRRKGRNI